jgi:outer membrane autotransporter protein
MRGEYKFATDAVDIVPHLGVRYTSLNVFDHDVKSGKEKIMSNDGSQQNIVIFPLGVSFSKDIETASGWDITPKMDLGVIFATGDVEATSKAYIAGVSGKAKHDVQVLDYTTFTGELGLAVKKDDWSAGLDYTLQASEHKTSHGLNATARFEF